MNSSRLLLLPLLGVLCFATASAQSSVTQVTEPVTNRQPEKPAWEIDLTDGL